MHLRLIRQSLFHQLCRQHNNWSICLCMLVFLLSACNNKLEKDIIGVWFIDDIIYNGKSIKDNLYSNAIVFKDDKTCSLPIYDASDFNTPKKCGTWDLKVSSKMVFISSSNDLIRGKFSVDSIWRKASSEGQYLKMILKGDKVKMYCTRDGAPAP